MPQQGSVGRRLEAAFEAFTRNDYETTLIHLFPALDKTAKSRRPKAGVGARIRSYLEDDEDLISYIATGNVLRNIYVGGKSIPAAIYEFGRCPIAHEGELDPRLKITEDTVLSIGNEWILPVSYIFAMLISLIVAEENSNEFFITDIALTIRGKKYSLNNLWGKERLLREETGLNSLLARSRSTR
ncbi:hypothetical protein ACVR26_002239 [Cronobacter sakazakii]